MAKQRHYFGTDGIRGQVNQPPMTVDIIMALGSAIVDWLRSEGNETPKIVIGRDTRRSGPILEAALSAGISANGGTCLSLGILPTPAVAWLTHNQQAALGVVLSASHNPYQDNGIKLFGADGYKLSDAQELAIEACLHQRLSGTQTYPSAMAVGTISTLTHTGQSYLKHILSLWPASLSLQGMRLVVDGAHGAAYQLGPTLFQQLGAEVIAVGNDPDGLNINEGVGALHPAALKPHVLQHNAHIGLAFDGDADRLIVVDEQGEVVDGDKIMGLCAIRMKQQGRLPHDTLVATVMSNLGLERSLQRHGIHLERTDVGDRYVLERMQAIGATLGGEQSGHLIFSEASTTGDGLLAALQLLRILVEEQIPLSQLAQEIDRYPQVLYNVKVREKRPWQDVPQLKEAIEAAQAELGDNGRVFVRYSGTENKARVMAEGPNEDQIERLTSHIAKLFQDVLGA